MSVKVINNSNKTHNDNHHNEDTVTVFGFWVYIMTDCILFGSLFATYAVLISGTFGGPGPKDIFDLKLVFVETLVLLSSSLTCGLALLALRRKALKQIIAWLYVTLFLGIIFISMELYEFHKLVSEGYAWTRSGFLASFFALIGTHGLHVISGLIWIIVLVIQLSLWGITASTSRKLFLFSIFWHFLEIIWIFVFTIVYLMGAI